MFAIEKLGRAALVLCGGATALVGCPLYADDCDELDDCASGFYCDQFSRRCQPVLDAVGCVRPSECEVGETCTPDFVCRPGSCDYHGCVNGYRCSVPDSAHACVTAGDAGPADAAADTSLGDATVEDASVDAAAGPGDAGTAESGASP
jgi:hypothetical protein